MMGFYELLNRHRAYYWSPPINDGYGDMVWPEPILIACVWQSSIENVVVQGEDPTQTIMSRAQVMAYNFEFEAGGALAQYDSSPPTTTDAFRILQANKVFLLTSDHFLGKAWLQ